MTIHPTRGSLVTLLLAVAVASCARPSEEPAKRENDLEKRVAKLEEALSARGEAGAARPAGASGEGAGQANSPHAGAGATPAANGGDAGGRSLEERIDSLEKDMARTLKTVRIPLALNKTGNEVCAEAGKACLTVLDDAGSARYDVHDQFCGHMVADCNARVTRKPHCADGDDFLLSPVKFYRSPGSKGECNATESETCESAPSDITALCLE